MRCSMVGLSVLSAFSLFAGLSALASAAAPQPAVGQAASLSQVDLQSQAAAATSLVQRLGDESYDERCRAEKHLTELGLAAQDALLAGLQHPDAEVRRGCRRVLADVAETDFQQRLQAFIDDPEGKKQHDLPGWSRYREIAGEGPEARALFVSILKEEAGLMESLEARSADAVKTRVSQVWNAMHGQFVKERRQPSVPTLAAMLLASSDSTSQGAEMEQFWMNFSNMFFQDPYAKALREGPEKQGLRALIGVWIYRPAAQHLQSQKLRLVVALGLEDLGLPLAVDALDNAKARQPNEVAMAIEAVARLGGKEHAGRLAALLDDDRTCQQRIVNNQRDSVQVSDVALAWLVQLTGQSHADYGMKQAAAWFTMIKQHTQNAFNFGNFFYEKAEDRQPAMEKWAEWVKQNPLPDPPTVEGKRLAVTPAAAVVAAARGAAVKGDTTGAAPQPPFGLRLAERAQVYQLTRARQLIEEQRYAEVVTLLGDILSADEDFFYQPDLSVPSYRQLKSQAELILSQLPTVGRDAYETHYGSIARAALLDALDRFDLAQLAEIERKYFFTAAGTEASFLLGTHHRMNGRPVQAAMFLERLYNLAPRASEYEPSLSLQLAISWQRAGLPDRACEVLRKLVERNSGGTIEIGGQTIPLFTRSDDPLAWLENAIGTVAVHSDNWPVFRKDISGNTLTVAGGPYLRSFPLGATVSYSLLVKTVKQIQQSYIEQRQTMLPAVHPLVVDGAVVFRTPTGIEAVELATGKLRWRAPALHGLWYLLRFADAKQQAAEQDALTRALQQRLWEDPSFGTMSSTGRLVLVIEDHAFPLSPAFQRPVIRPDGRREIDPAPLATYNLLAAYDVRSGKLKWEIGGAPGTAGQPLAGGRFQGPPLPLGDHLYAVVEFKEQMLLVSLDATTGDLVDQWILDAPWDEEQDQATFGRPQFYLPQPDPPRGVSPVYAQGLVICCTSKNRYVAVDLAARTIRWAFAPPAPATTNNQMQMIILQQRQMGRQLQADRSDQWCDAGATVGGGRVLLTPWDTDQLFCLNLADGSVAWTAPRQDGLYVAGIHEDKALVVGRGRFRALQLADGAEAFGGATAWPAGSVPSGRGYLTADRLYVPLNSAEVVAIDLADGRVAARSLSPDGVVPGNLLRIDNYVVSCSPARLDRFETLETRLEELAATERPPEQDLAGFLRHTEVLLYAGQLQKAIDRLLQAQQVQSSPEIYRLLGEALLQLTGADWKSRRELAADVEASIEDPELRARFLERLIAVHRDAGEIEAALATCLKLVDVSADRDKPIYVSPAHSARRGLCLYVTLTELLGLAAPDVRSEFEQQIAQRLRSAPTPETLEVFGFHPDAESARLQLAAGRTAEGRWIEAELLLRRVLQAGTPGGQAEATARLADLLRTAGKTLEAARCYAVLNGPLADTVVLDGQTGRQRYAALPDEDPVRGWIEGQGPWPLAEPSKRVTKVEPAKARQNWNYASLLISGDGTDLSPLVSADIDLQTRKLLGFDGQGARQYELALAEGSQANQFYIHNQILNDAQTAGHLMVVWLGTRVVAVDQLAEGGKVLWSADAVKIEGGNMWMVPQLQLRMQLGAQMMQGPLVRGSLPQSVALTTDYVAFQQQRLLTAVDPLTGQTLWLRDDQSSGADLFGDRELLLVVPTNSTTATVLNARDGRELGTRQLPDKDNRLAALGRTFVLWERADDKQVLQRFDPWTQAADWSCSFAAKSQTWMIGNNEIAVMEPAGRFVVLSLIDGRTMMETTVDEEPELESIFVLAAGERYILIANRPEPKVEGPMFWNRNAPGQMRVEGKVYGLDARTGQRQWMTEVKQQWIKINHPSLAPVLTFFRRHQKAIQGPNNSWRSDQPQVQLTCLDTRTGKTLHESEIKNSHEQAYGLIVDPVEGEVRVHTRLERVTFRYRPGEASPDLIEGEDPGKPGDASPEIDEETRQKLKAAEAAGGARIMIQAQAGRIQSIEKLPEIEMEKEKKEKEEVEKPDEKDPDREAADNAAR